MRERGLTGERGGEQDRGKGWWVLEGGGSGVCVVPGSKGMECCSDVRLQEGACLIMTQSPQFCVPFPP